jgi:SAM-dependent methyltransferase
MLGLYDRIGENYARYRQADPRIAVMVNDALGRAKSVLNVGAGTGSYEPRDGQVVAVEPSAVMIAQRRRASGVVVQASAMALPFGDQAFEASMAILTVHHWPDRERGLAEMKRVTRGPCVILTWERPSDAFWLTSDYLPHFLEADRKIFPPWFRNRASEVRVVPVPHDCADGFLCAYWRRPQAYLDARVRGAISTFSRVGDFERGLERLRRELEDGTWQRKYGHLLNETERDWGYRLVTI